MKVSIIGVGHLGNTLAYTLAMKQFATEISLVDPLNPDVATGHALDLQQALTLVGPIKIFPGSYETTADADVVVITGGAKRKSDESRLDLIEKNTEITKQIIGNVLDYNQSCILIVANNPVDITTYTALKLSNFPRERVIGTGTLLDSLRFRFLLAEAANLNPETIESVIIGEHGDSLVPILSTTSVNGINIFDASSLTDENISKIVEKVKGMGSKLLTLKGGSTYTPALSIAYILDAIKNNNQILLPLSVYLQGEYGLDGLCMSVPVRLGHNGIEEIIEIKLTDEERRQLDISAGILKSEISDLY